MILGYGRDYTENSKEIIGIPAVIELFLKER
jgi:hypothetical protein